MAFPIPRGAPLASLLSGSSPGSSSCKAFAYTVSSTWYTLSHTDVSEFSSLPPSLCSDFPMWPPSVTLYMPDLHTANSPFSHCLYACAQPLKCVPVSMDKACQAPLSIGLSQQEYWSGLPSPPPGFPTQGSNPSLLQLLHWQADSFLLSHLGSPSHWVYHPLI